MSLSSLRGTPEPDLLEDMKALEECLQVAEKPRKGFWTLFVVLAWIATRDEKFVAATQLYVTRNHADRGSLFSFAAWLCLGRAAEAREGGIGFEAAEDQLREALEAGRLDGGVARSLMTNKSAPVSRDNWVNWDANYENFGIVLIPGLYDFRWPSEAVQAEFSNVADKNDRTEKTDAEVTRQSGRGRRAGVGGYAADDAQLLVEMHALIKDRQASSPWDAARQVAAKAKGSENNRQRRLAQAYNREYDHAS